MKQGTNQSMAGSRTYRAQWVEPLPQAGYRKSPRNLNWQTAWWHADLQEYDYQLEYIPEKTNTVADALSRPTDADQGQEDNKNITILVTGQLARGQENRRVGRMGAFDPQDW